jgi:hypothetical protein
MNSWTDYRFFGLPTAYRKHAAQHLKRCPVCGTLNAVRNDECITCRWHGSFERDVESIEEGLIEMIDRCPELVQAILPPPRRRFRLWSWLGETLGRIFRRPVNFRV